jgi:hypothetical protein
VGRFEIRDLVCQAQEAEVQGDVARAVSLLTEAARLHAAGSETERAAVLYRHCLRLCPDRVDLRAALQDLETRASVEKEAGTTVPRRLHLLELPQRGPTAADPSLDCWCSFCCRPKREVGPMVAGPAGAFICRVCIEAASPLAAPQPVSGSQGEPPPASSAGFIAAAVALSRELGWSLTEVRQLAREEIDHALDALDKLRQSEGKPPVPR